MGTRAGSGEFMAGNKSLWFIRQIFRSEKGIIDRWRSSGFRIFVPMSCWKKYTNLDSAKGLNLMIYTTYTKNKKKM